MEKAIAQRLAMLGADVFIHSYSPYDATKTWGADPDGISALIALLQKYGTRIAQAQGNFLDPAVPGQIMGTAVQTFGHIDILITNHAYSKMGNIEQLTTAEIDTQMHINVRGKAPGCRRMTATVEV
ncbi:SDR family NAD(P)-dependent oxidoreductase [Nostoc sp. FACHB-892]|uniref:SDR family NAD(P)-dependent oxidoreductase n=1 Tax=Nostoc sp. FACHB-892 TaxID=2692843 RepID=UPI001682A63C|nr:SDR family NAD(P)-dependent oxidoreductase [Nostoc sp. FACHB-892]MBD2730849.1 SDR family NAD(P)-dependent oxidoreductase [Nostoc sp. FACHB-892]